MIYVRLSSVNLEHNGTFLIHDLSPSL